MMVDIVDRNGTNLTHAGDRQKLIECMALLGIVGHNINEAKKTLHAAIAGFALIQTKIAEVAQTLGPKVTKEEVAEAERNMVSNAKAE